MCLTTFEKVQMWFKEEKTQIKPSQANKIYTINKYVKESLNVSRI